MERLTTCKEITKDTDMTQELGYSHIYKRLAEYEDAEEQGRLPYSPCPRCKHNWHTSHSTPLEMHNPCHQCAFRYPYSNFEAAPADIKTNP